MKTRLAFLFVLLFVLTQWHLCDGQDLRKIVPLKSTRAEVERLLGPAKASYGVVYQIEAGSLSIEYSSGPCRPERKGGWNVPEDVVINFNLTPKHKRGIARFRFDQKKLRKEIDEELPEVYYYIDDQNGIVYTIQGGKVDSIEYGPTKRDKHLYCGDPAEGSHRVHETKQRF